VTQAQIKSDENTIFFAPGVILLSIVAAIAIGLIVESNKILAVGLLTVVTLSILGLGSCAYRGNLSPSYRSWLQWAKERKSTM
jgi:phosphoenolpyruvate carboxylase